MTDRYPETIYYRLLAHKYLPNDIKRILYLDADVLCINDLSRLYELDFEGNLYAAASHSGLTNVKNVINNVRLGAESGESYFNSGVLLMNLGKESDESSILKELSNMLKKTSLICYCPIRTS